MNTIAIIEDNASNMKLMCGILQRAEYKVIEVSNADNGIPIIIESSPDLILMDIHMPGTDGLTATRILKKEPRTKHIPIIAVTARAMDGDREMILEAGCDGYISKPIRYKELLDLIKEKL